MAINPKNLAQTNARVPASIVIQIKTGDEGAVTIGAATGMSVNMSRRLTRRFELDTDIPGRSVEIIPGALQDLSLRIKRAMLYNNLSIDGGDFVEYLKKRGIYTAYDILAQKYPFDVIEKRYNPTNPGESDSYNEVVYKSCFVESVPYDYEITGEWLIIQDISVWASNVSYK